MRARWQTIMTQFITAKIWNQPKCRSTDEWIKKTMYTHIHINIHTHTVLFIHK